MNVSVRATAVLSDPRTGQDLVYLIESVGPKLLDITIASDGRASCRLRAIGGDCVDPVLGDEARANKALIGAKGKRLTYRPTNEGAE